MVGLSVGYNCSILNNTVSVAMDIEQNIMIPQNITYIITLGNVSTATSLAPLQYSLWTTYNGTVNQKFSTLHSLQSAYQTPVVYSKSNFTINQQFRLSLTITPISLLYDSWQVILPKSVVYIEQSYIPAFALSSNTTHYILNQTGTMANNYTQILAKNSLSTSVQPIYTINLYQGSYLSQQTVITPAMNSPVVLGCAVTMSNRSVSMGGNMTVVCDRNNNGELG